MEDKIIKEGDEIHGSAIGKKKRGGVANISNAVKTGKEYFNAYKYTIIATNGCGKTTLAFDLLYYLITPFKNVMYINRQFDDKVVRNFSDWCKRAGLGFFEIQVPLDKYSGLNIPKLEYCVYIIDDTYTSTGRNSALELLIKQLWNSGRWDGNHVVYIAHLDNRLPSEALHNANAIFVDRPYKRFPVSQNIPDIGEHWYMLENGLDPVYGTVDGLVFDEPRHIQQIIQRLSKKKNKIPGQTTDKLSTENDYFSIGMQGNEEAMKQLAIKKAEEEAPKVTGRGKKKIVTPKHTIIDESTLPMFGTLDVKKKEETLDPSGFDD